MIHIIIIIIIIITCLSQVMHTASPYGLQT
jgi:hypothetical protein